MFTGIIRHRGTVQSLSRGTAPRLVVAIRGLRVRRGDSVAVDGVCLTVTRHNGGRLVFDLLAETLRATTLGFRRPGDRVNLERSLRVGDDVGGHWVMGHVDGVGRIIARRPSPGGLTVTIQAPAALRRYLAPKGAVAVDGVSLTLGPRVPGSTFIVYVIPHTAAVTTLGFRHVGDLVNLEVDPVARYVATALATASGRAVPRALGPWLRHAERAVPSARWRIDAVR